MRVAISGTHRTGKTTLLEAVQARLPRYTVIDEPYRLLEEEGHELADPPSTEDFEQMLRVSLEVIASSGANTLFDRSPLDQLAYLKSIDGDTDIDSWIEEVRDAMETLDLVVLVPIEEPDRIAVPAHEDRRLRGRVDELLHTLLIDDPYDFGTDVLEVRGTLDERVAQLVVALGA